jgi:preprotein translocase subunit SecG
MESLCRRSQLLRPLLDIGPIHCKEARALLTHRAGNLRKPARFTLTIFVDATIFICYHPAMGILAVLPYVQIVLSVALVVAILLQRTGASLGGAFGADNFSSGFHTRRGLEKTLFYATIVLAVLFALSALINLLLS